MPDKFENGPSLTRREFTLESALALLAGVTITITGCGGDDGGSTTSPSPVADASGTISANHGHAATISAAELTAGLGVRLDIRAQATHPHIVELTSDEVTRIRARQQVSKVSTTDNNHSHTVTFN
jgi:hypothetical protein